MNYTLLDNPFTGNTTGFPTYTAPCTGNTTYFTTVSFVVTQSGSYGISTCGSAHNNTVVSVYQNYFNPATPSVNLLACNGDACGPEFNSRGRINGINLVPGQTYIVVVGTENSAGDYHMTINGPGALFEATPGEMQWFVAPTGGTPIATGNVFNPVGVTGSGLPNTSTPGTYTYYAACENSDCRVAADFIITTMVQISCPVPYVAQTSNDGTGDCSTLVPIVHPSTTAQCPFTLAVTYSAGTPAPLSLPVGGPVTPGTTDNVMFYKGQTIISYTATDLAGNISTCSTSVTVTDNENPSINCPASITQSNDPGVCGATVNYIVDGTDNCIGYNILQTAGLASGSIFPIGITTNTFQITDASGHTATCSFTVTINETEAPTISCVTDQTRNTNNGVCTYTVVGTEFNPTAFADNCTGSTISNDYNNSNTLAGAIFPKGTTTVTWTVTDASGNTATCSFDVTVNDTQNPTITCVDNQSRNANNGVCTYTAVGTEFNPTAFADNCTGSTISNDYNSSSTLAGAIFPKGTTTVTWTVTDASGNTATCSFDVTVNDTQNPTITCVATRHATQTMVFAPIQSLEPSLTRQPLQTTAPAQPSATITTAAARLQEPSSRKARQQ